MRRTGVISVACIALALVAAGCNHDGRTLRPARLDQNATVSTTTAPTTTVAADVIGDDADAPTSTAVGGSLGGSLGSGSTIVEPTSAVASVVDPASVLAPWRDGAAIDARYSCNGANVSPPLSWSPAPAGTAEIAITMTDVQAPTFVHWAIAGLNPDVTTIDEGEVPDGAIRSTNGAGGLGYTGPCPPQGQMHTYVVTVHFLGSQTELGDGAQGADLLAVIDAATIAQAQVTGTFTRV